MDGFLLMGGEGRRFGAPKQDAILAGRTFASWGLHHLRTALGADARIWMVAPAGRPGPAPGSLGDEHPLRLDDESFGAVGPLGGILAACRQGGGLVLAVDMPAVPTRALARLCQDAGPRPVAFTVQGRLEPLLAFWPREAEDAVRRVLAGSRRVGDAFREAGGCTRDWRQEDPQGTHTWAFRNVNTRSDLDLLTSWWPSGPRSGGTA